MTGIIKSIKKNRVELSLLLSILLVAATLRFYNLGWEAFSWNEGTHLGGSKEFLKGNFLHNFNDFATPPLLKYFGAIALYFFGFSEFFLRSIGVIFGLGTIILTYLVARRYYDKNISLFASAILAFSIIHIDFSRTFLTEPVLGFFFIVAFYAYLRITKDGDRKKWSVILGICVALALLSKWIGLNLILAIIAHAIYSKYIKIGIRKKFSIEIEGWIIKSFIVFLITFFIIWPMALYPIKLDVNVKVVGMEDRGDTFILNVPTILLSPQEYFTVALGREEKVADPSILPVMQFPFVGYGLLMFSKESLLFGVLFVIGLFAIYKKRRSIDKDILIFLGIFLLILWLQKYGQTYRYIIVIMPLAAIVVARSLSLVNKKIKIPMIIFFSLGFLITAAVAHPDYNNYYNYIDDVFHFKLYDQEIRNINGYREGIEYIKENCQKVTGNMAGTLINYVGDPETFIAQRNLTQSDIPFCYYIESEERFIKEVKQTETTLNIKCVLSKEIVVIRGHLSHFIYQCN